VPVNAAASDAPLADWSPRVATDGAGIWVAVWQDYVSSGGVYSDILMSRSTNNGAAWSAPVAVSQAGAINSVPDPSVDLEPSVAFGDGAWVVVWSANERTSATAPFTSVVKAARSSNGGASFGAPAIVAPAGPAGSTDTASSLAFGGGGFAVTWLRLQPAAAPRVLHAQSTNGGATWGGAAQAAVGGFAAILAVKDDGARAVGFADGNEDRSGDIRFTMQMAASAGAADWQLYR
jgi:hypothetical protein